MGQRGGLTKDEKQRLKELERENRELKRANEICARRQRFSHRRNSTADPDGGFHRDESRPVWGRVDLSVLPRPIDVLRAPGTEKNPDRLPARAKRDAKLRVEIDRVWRENRQVYGVRKVWKQLNRENTDVARCTVERLMREMGLEGVVRGRKIKTTIQNEVALRPADLVDRDSARPVPMMDRDLTYVATWRGFVYVHSSSMSSPERSSVGERCIR